MDVFTQTDSQKGECTGAAHQKVQNKTMVDIPGLWGAEQPG